MSDPSFRTGVAGIDRVNYDAGLRDHMQKVFNYMGGGLALTGIVAWIASQPEFANVLYGTPLMWLVMFAPLGFVFFMSFQMQRLSSSTLKGLFAAYCGSMGLSLGTIFLIYTHAAIANAFFVSAAMFAGMGIWGYATKRDLSGMGSFLFMALLGLIIAAIVGIFVHSTGFQMAISIGGVIIFTGLTAWDMQRIKQTYAENWGTEANDKLAVMGALSLYLDFINIFMSMLRLMGGRRD